MNLQRPYGPKDEPSLPDGDAGFVGVEERLPPALLQPGYVAAARNKRFRNGRASTRDGITLLPWMKGDGKQPFDEVYGGAVFSDPNDIGVQWILIAADGGCWRTRANGVAVPIALPAGVTLTRDTFAKFLQANGAILLLRGLDDDVLQCTNLEEGFKPIVQENVFGVTFDAATNRVGLPQHNLLVGDPVVFSADPGGAVFPSMLTAGQTYYVLDTPNADEFTITDTPGGDPVTWNTSPTDTTQTAGLVTVLDGAQPIPPASDGIFFLNRVLLINGKDTAALSDIGDFTRYQPVASTFRINEGDSQRLLAAAVFNQDTVVFFKDGSVSKVTGVSGDLSNAQGPLNMSRSYGAAGPRAVTTHGVEIFWLSSELRVQSLTLTELNQEQDTNNALSDPLVQTFGRVAAQYAAGARLAVHDGFLHVALPLDEARIVSGPELIPAGSAYPATVAVVPGRTYQYQQGPTAATLVNGTETLRGDADFTAQGNSVVLTGTAGMTSQDSVRWVQAVGVNTAVAVYDFLNQAWAGTDESPPDEASAAPAAVGTITIVNERTDGGQAAVIMGPGPDLLTFDQNYLLDVGHSVQAQPDFWIGQQLALAVPIPGGTVFRGTIRIKDANTYEFDAGVSQAPSDRAVTAVVDWLKFYYGGRERLGFIGADGWLHLYYEGYEDDVLTPIAPYVDVVVDQVGLATLGQTLQVNGGTLVTAVPGPNPWNQVGGVMNWGPDPSTLWRDVHGVGGYDPTSANPWSAPNTIVTPIDSGVRFTATNGVLPEVRLNGAVVTDGASGWAFLDSHPGPSEIVAAGIDDLVRTRAFPCYRLYVKNMVADSRRYLAMAAQIATWSPNYTIRAVTPGVQTQADYVTDETRDRLQYFQPWDGSDWDPSNVNDDYGAAKREDYSYAMLDAGIFLESGIVFDQTQEFVHRVPVQELGVWMQLEIENTDGRLELLAVAMESEGSEVLSGPQAS